MATYQNTGVVAKPLNPAFAAGKKLRVVNARVVTDDTGAGGTAGDVFILSGPHSFSDRIARIMAVGGVPAIAGATDNNIGFYKKVNGAFVAIDADVLIDGDDYSTGLAGTRDLLAENAALDRSLNIAEVLGLAVDAEPAGGVYVGWELVAAATADVTVDLDIHVDEATTS